MGFTRYIYLALILTLLPSLTLAESDITGWARAKWGMSHAQIAKIYPLNPWEPGDSPTCKMKQKVNIMGRDFGVAFYFDQRSPDGKLYRVVLAHFTNDLSDVLWLKSVKEMLVAKYGNPDTFEIHGKMKASRWQKSENRLKLTTVTGQTVMCTIEYVSLGSESNKL